MFSKRYQLLEQLGRGGMGVVYRAYDKLTDQTVSLKRVLLHPSLQDPTLTRPITSAHDTMPISDTQEIAAQRLSIVREFETLASIRHPYIRPVLEFGFDEEQTPYLVMAYVDDPRSIVAAGNAVDIAGKVRLLIPVLQALAYLHRRRLVHQDLKPANLLVDPTGHVYVVDFGLTMAAHAATETTALIGSLPYLAPELLRGAPPTPATDLYAIGIVCYQMFTGCHPFRLESTQALFEDILDRFADPTPLIAASNPAVATVIARLLEKSPAQRYTDAQKVIADLCTAVGIAAPTEEVQVRESYLTSAPFVGRHSELQMLQTALREASEGHGSAWLVTGEAGVGKSRLLYELRCQALVRGFTVLSGQATEAAGSPYQLWRTILPSLALLASPDDAAASILAEVVPEVATVLGHDLPPPPALDGVESQERLVQAILALFARINTPLVLLLEDLHWDRQGLPLLRPLTQTATELPLLIISTCRSDESPYLYGGFPHMRLLPLSALGETDVASMARSVLGNRAGLSRVVKYLQTHAEGNALLVVETLRTLAERAGELDKVSTAEFPAQLVTQGLVDMLKRRIERLPAHAFDLLYLAAILGRELDLKVLAAVVDADTLDDWLTVCVDAALITVSHGVWRFAHDKIRDGVQLQAAGAASLPALHAQAAKAIEAAYPGELRYARKLADHWWAAGEVVKALPYALEAGRQLVAVDPLSAQAYLAALLGRFPRSLPTSAQHMVMTANKLLGTAYAATATYGLARQHLETANTLAQVVGDTLARCRALLELGNLHWEQGAFDVADATLSMSIGMARKGGHWREAVRGLTLLALVLRVLRRPDQALWAIHEASTLLHGHEEAFGLWAVVHYAHGLILLTPDHDAAMAYLRQSLDLSRTHMMPRQTILALNSLGFELMQMGRYMEALSHLMGALHQARASTSRFKLGTILSNIAETYSRMGRHEEAMRYLAQSLKVGLELRNVRAVLDGILVAAGLYLRIERNREAAEFVALLLAHPSLNPEDRHSIERDLLPQFQLTLVPAVLTAILQRGRYAEPFGVAESILLYLRVD
jgi:tetratricopeptide (TPR) repeat protein